MGRDIKRLLGILAIASFSAVSFSAEIVNYSGRLVQSSGAPVTGNVDITVKVFENTTERCSVAFTNVSLSNGVFNLAIDFENQCNAGADSLSNVIQNASGADLTIEITDVTNTVTYPKQPLNAVPFALTSLTSTPAAGTISFSGLNEDGSCDHTQNQYLFYNAAGQFICRTLTPGGVTSLTAGTGIDLSASTGAITVGLSAGGVSATELASDAVTTVKILDANVTTAKIADSNVTTAKIADNNVTNAKIVSMDASKLTGTAAAIDGSNITNISNTVCTGSDYLAGDGTCITPTDNDTTYTAGSGLDLTGTVFSIDTQGVTNSMLAGIGANCANGEILKTNGLGSFYCATVDLGSHVATQDLDLATFKLVGNGGTAGISIANDGNVGIGTTTPRSKLDVDSGVIRANAYFAIGKGPNNNDQFTFNLIPDNTGNYTPAYSGAANAGGAIVGMPSGGNGGLVFRTSRFGTDGTAKTEAQIPERMRITDDGKVGIGTSSPSATFDVRYTDETQAVTFTNTSAAGNRAAIVTNKATGDDYVYWKSVGQNYSWTHGLANDDRFSIGPTATFGASSILNILASGNVGIGTIAPTQKLTVDGNINVTTGNDVCIDGGGCLSSAIAGGGETNTASSLGGTSLVGTKSGVDLQFRGLTSSSDITLTQNANDVNIAIGATNGNSQLVRLDGSGALPAIDGSNLTGLTDNDTTYTAGSGLDLTGTVFSIPAQGIDDLKLSGISTSCANGEVLKTNGLGAFYCGTDIDTQNTIDTSTSLGTSNTVVPSQNAVKAYVDSAVSGVNASQWTTNVSDIYYSAGNVGIGTTTPAAPLQVMNPSSAGLSVQRTAGAEAVVRAHGSNTYFGSMSNHDSHLITNGSNRLTVKSTGEVGIGTDSPIGNFHVSGTGPTVIDRVAANPAHLLLRSARGTVGAETAPLIGEEIGRLSFTGHDGTNWATVALAGVAGRASENWTTTARGTDLEFKTVTTGSLSEQVRMTIANSGDVGIGTTTPQRRLHLRDSDTGIRLESTNADDASYGFIEVFDSDGDNMGLVGFDSGTNSDLTIRTTTHSDGIDFQTNGSTSRMYISQDGNVGVGTINPLNDFQVGDQISLFTTTNSGYLNGNSYWDGTNWRYINNNMASVMTVDNAAGDISFHTAPAGTAGNIASFTERMTIANDGAVSVGTEMWHRFNVRGDTQGAYTLGSSPEYTYMPSGTVVNVYGEGTTNNAALQTFQVQTTGGSNQQAFFGAVSENTTANAPAALVFGQRTGTTAWTERMRIDSAGNLGLNTDDPKEEFQIGTAMSFHDGGNEGIGFYYAPGLNQSLETGKYPGFLRYADGALTFESSASTYTAGDTATMTKHFTIGRDGRVGIGTMSPAGSLDVNGDICLGGVCRTTWPSGGGSGAFTDGGSLAYYNGGNVGIGTATPTHPLSVQTTGNTVLKLDSTAASGRSYHVTSHNSGIFKIYDEDAASDRLVIDSTGNVGIGTSAPSSKLQVLGGVARVDKGGTGESLILTGTGSNLQFDHDGGADVGMRNSSGGGITIKNSSGASDLVHFANDGSVGYGTTTPVGINHIVNTTGAGKVELRLEETTTNSAAQIYYQNLARTWDVGGDASPDGFYVQEVGGSQDAFFIAGGTNNVGIGTNTPSSKLTVDGNIEISPVGTTDYRELKVNRTVASVNEHAFISVNGINGRTTLGSQNNGIGFTANNAGSGSHDVVITTAGDMGIGTETPAGKLDVIGDLCISGDCRSSWPGFADNGANTSFTGGYVGIGTANPERSLHIVGTGGVDDDMIIESNSNTASSGLLTFMKSRGTNAAKAAILNGDPLGEVSFRGHDGSAYAITSSIASLATDDFATSKDAKMVFKTAKAGVNQTRMTITQDGDVAIGSHTPEAALDVRSNVMFGDKTLQNAGYASIEDEANLVTVHKADGVSSRTSALGAYSIFQPTADTARGAIGNVSIAYADIPAGVTSTSYVTGSYVFGVRNRYTGNNDNGNLGSLYGVNVQYGHDNGVPANTPNTTSAYGLRIQPLAETGNITSMYDFMIMSKATGATVTDHWGIYQAGTDIKNYFGSKVGINTPQPTTDLHIVGSSTMAGDPDPVSSATKATINLEANTNDYNLMLDANEITHFDHSLTITSHDTSGTDGHLYFNTGNTSNSPATRMSIMANGDIGIGTVNPDAKMRLSTTTTDNYPTATTHGGILFKASNSNNAVEIGSSNTSNARRAWILARHSDETTYGQYYSTLHLQPNPGGISYHRGVAIGWDPSYQLAENVTGLSVKEHVGIGTFSPNGPLEVYSGDDAGLDDDDDGITITNYQPSLYFKDISGGAHDQARIRMNSGDLHFETSADFHVSSPTYTTAMTLDDGKLGIGTTTPTGKLSLIHSGTIGGYSANVGNAALHISTSGSSVSTVMDTNEIQTFGTSMNLRGEDGINFHVGDHTDGDNIDVMHITSAGYVGIGTSAPSNRLHVSGNLGATGWVGAGCEGACDSGANGYALIYNDGRVRTYSGSGSACLKYGNSATFSCSSDERLKNTIADFEKGLDHILKLRPRTYFWNDEEEGDLQYGFIAQEVQKVIPHAITDHEREGETYLALDQGAFTPYIINAIQDLDEKINGNRAMFEFMQTGLENKVSANERKIASLEEELSKVKSEKEMMKQYLCSKDPSAPFCK